MRLTERDVLALASVRRKAADGRARAIRLAADITLREIGQRCGTSTDAVSGWQLGKRVPRGRPAVNYAYLLRALEEQTAADAL
jgi:transcriptional regulator with XRE-family HTH domain